MIQLHEKDNVAVVVDDIPAGQQVQVRTPGDLTDWQIDVVSPIPFGHKCALSSIGQGELVCKYGHPIGKATKDIAKGEVVGVHNIEGLRGRGDLGA